MVIKHYNSWEISTSGGGIKYISNTGFKELLEYLLKKIDEQEC